MKILYVKKLIDSQYEENEKYKLFKAFYIKKYLKSRS